FWALSSNRCLNTLCSTVSFSINTSSMILFLALMDTQDPANDASDLSVGRRSLVAKKLTPEDPTSEKQKFSSIDGISLRP
ncbi:MAG: hypothetical protein ACKOCL_00790, partial [Candidatus Nanopelagicaceae bacterium]